MSATSENTQPKQPFREQVRLRLAQLKNLIVPQKDQPATPLVKQEEFPSATSLPAEEKPPTPLHLGTHFQEAMSGLPADSLPPQMESGGVLAMLGTNEILTDDLVKSVRGSDQPPNGFIFGAGFGNILSTTLLYPEGSMPKALCAVDVIPDVVVAGRIMTNFLAESTTYAEFKSKLTSADELSKQFEAVVSSEPNPYIQERMRSVNIQDVLKSFQRDCEMSSNYNIRPGAIVPNDGNRVDVLSVINVQFDKLHDMAGKGNIAVAYADMTSPVILEQVKNLPGFEGANNVIYMSNVIDHLTSRGTDLSRLHAFDVLKELGEGKNWFVDTTQNSLNYSLRATNEVPNYHSSDVEYKIRY